MHPKNTLMRLSLLFMIVFHACYVRADDSPTVEFPINQLIEAAQSGDETASYHLGLKYFTGAKGLQDYREAAKWFELAAAEEYLDAYINLGFLYDMGIGVPQNHREAAKWYTKAAEKGNSTAQFNLGILYNFGKGVSQDYSEAAKWYTLAAKQGCLGAQYNLGNMYLAGIGVPQDSVTAEMWYLLAAAYDHAESKKQHDWLIRQLTPEQFEQAYESACEIGKDLFATVSDSSHAGDS